MKNFFTKLDFDKFIDLFLVMGTIFLMYTNTEGWGWLLTLLFVRS